MDSFTKSLIRRNKMEILELENHIDELLEEIHNDRKEIKKLELQIEELEDGKEDVDKVKM